MGTLFSALNIGRTGLFVSQVQLDTVAHNISNVNKEGFSRQRVNLTTRLPNIEPFGAIGRGPAIAGIERAREPFLDRVLRRQLAGLGSADAQATFFSRIEDVFQEPSEDGFASRLNVFFDSLNDFANNVEEIPVRVSVLSEADTLADSLNELAGRLQLLRTQANQEIRDRVPQINSLTGRIAELNDTIRSAELGDRTANDLRDDRDVLLDELAQLVNITTNERDSGVVDVLVAGEELVRGDTARDLIAVRDDTIDPEFPQLFDVRFADNEQPLNITGGELFGVLQIRDAQLPKVQDRLDTLARGLIESINRIHTQGNGLENIRGPLSASNTPTNAAAPLNSAGLPFDVQDGSFDFVLFDSTGAEAERVTVNINASGPPSAQTSTAGILSQLNAGLTDASATLDANGDVRILPASGFSFTFENDTSGALTALGLNGLFTGEDAASIDVSQHLLDNPEFLSSGFSIDPTETGDNRAALAMAAVRNQDVLDGNTQTINEFFESSLVEVGVDARRNADILDLEQSFVQDFERRRQEVSGVNLDEEVTSLIQFQRAFEASARVITVTDRMLGTLLNIVQ